MEDPLHKRERKQEPEKKRWKTVPYCLSFSRDAIAGKDTFTLSREETDFYRKQLERNNTSYSVRVVGTLVRIFRIFKENIRMI